jgi:hypothetical protein
MTEFLFEQYMDPAVEFVHGDAKPGHDQAKDIAKLELPVLSDAWTAAESVAHAIPMEAVVILNALHVAEVPTDTKLLLHTRSLLWGPNDIKDGWHVSEVEGAKHHTVADTDKQDDPYQLMLSNQGVVYGYRRRTPDEDSPANGIMQNFYTPGTSTPAKERSITFGFAVLVARHELEPVAVAE